MADEMKKNRIKIKDVQPGDVISPPVNPDARQFLVEDNRDGLLLTELDRGLQSSSQVHLTEEWKKENGETVVLLYGEMEKIVPRKISWIWRGHT